MGGRVKRIFEYRGGGGLKVAVLGRTYFMDGPVVNRSKICKIKSETDCQMGIKYATQTFF